MTIWYYAEEQTKSKMLYILDHYASTAVKSKYMDLQIQAMGKHYYPDNIKYVEDFLYKTPEFYVLNSEVWFVMRIQKNPHFTHSLIKKGLIHVKRV